MDWRPQDCYPILNICHLKIWIQTDRAWEPPPPKKKKKKKKNSSLNPESNLKTDRHQLNSTVELSWVELTL